MNVTCALCNIKKDLDDNSFLSKRLRNNPVKIYICEDCYERIKDKSLSNIKQKQNR